MKILLLSLLLGFFAIEYSQTNKQQVFLFVHGAWGGGWEYQKVDSILTVKGHIVYRPTLTGLGERSHLANPEINLTTHINDIVNVIKYEELHNVILIGHSYGGMVISGVAEQVPERIKQLIYLDAFVPKNGESIYTIIEGPAWDNLVKPNIKEGFVSYTMGPKKSIPPTDVPQPLRTFTEDVQITNPLAKLIPANFLLMMEDGVGGFTNMAIEAKERGWPVFQLEGGHYPMREQPEELVKKLEAILIKK